MNIPEKLSTLSSLILRPSQWDEVAARWSQLIPHDFPGDYAALLKRKVSEGSWSARHVVKDGETVGFVVYDVEQPNECPAELNVIAMAGRDGSDMSEQVSPFIFALAKEHECKTVRFHTMRAGLVSKAQKLGFRVSEIILRADVN